MTSLEHIIYLDILLAINLFVNYFILLSVAKFLYLRPKRLKLVLGACVGAFFSLYIFLPEQNIIFSLIIKILMAALIIITSFGFKNSNFFKLLTCFCLMSFSFSGLNFVLWLTFKPYGMIFNNGIVYFNISPLILIFSTLIAYFILEFMNKFLGKHICKELYYHVFIKFDNKNAEFDAMLDTGNNLKEPFSNLPVILVRQKDIKNIINININKNIFDKNYEINNKFRLIPFCGVSDSGFILGFKPDFVKIETSNKNKKYFEKDAYIGICDEKNLNNCLIGPEILDN